MLDESDDEIDYSLQRLRMNEVVTTTWRQGRRNNTEYNTSIFIEFNGTIEVLSEYRDISVSRNNNLTP